MSIFSKIKEKRSSKIDKKLNDIGFIKMEENDFVVSYERLNEKYDYTQVIDILHKESGRHIVQSYDRDLFDTSKIGNTCVGLTSYELKLLRQKMLIKGWKSI